MNASCADIFPVQAGRTTRRQARSAGSRCLRGCANRDRLPEPIFTPSTKATTGHDENISFDETVARIGRPLAEKLRDTSLTIYKRAAEYAAERGIIIADTKFEFGLIGDDLIWIDEALTPDSSRFWPGNRVCSGKAATFVRQAIRPRLSRAHRLEQAAAGTGLAARRCCRHTGQIQRSLSTRYRPRTRLSPGENSFRGATAERAIVKDQLESLVGMMVERGILLEEAVVEFEKKFIRRVLERCNGNQSRAAIALGIHRNTLSRKVDEYKLDHVGRNGHRG